MGHDSSPVEPIRPGRRVTSASPMKRLWLVEYQGREERIEADDVEVTASGVLAFYRCASRTDRDRTLVTAFSPALAWRCQLESER